MKVKSPFRYHVTWKYFLRAINFITLCCSYVREWYMPHNIYVYVTSNAKNTQHTYDRSVLVRVTPYVLVGSRLLDFWTRIISYIPKYKMLYVVLFHWEQPWKEPNVNWIDLLFIFGKHRLQKPTRFVGLPTKWKISPKTDEIMGNCGTATAVPAVPRAAPL